ncbi:MAG TPA: hypothetical protein V6D27_09545 [Vampirovibrionales bacterium]
MPIRLRCSSFAYYKISHLSSFYRPAEDGLQERADPLFFYLICSNEQPIPGKTRVTAGLIKDPNPIASRSDRSFARFMPELRQVRDS